MTSYAANTAVPVDRSRDELYRTLKRYDATETALAERPGEILVGFAVASHGVEHRILMRFSMPQEREYRTLAQFQKEERRRWRVIILAIKSRFELMEATGDEIERVFMADLLLPGGGTMGDEGLRSYRAAAREGRLPVTLFPSLDTGRTIALPAGNPIQT